MNERHLAALFRIEVRRQAKALLRIWAGMVALVAASSLMGFGDPGFRVAVVFGMGLGTSLSVPMKVARDKLKGRMEFLVMLPTATTNLVGARFLAVAAEAVLWAVPAGVVAWMVDPFPGLSMSRSALASGVTVGWWAVLSMLGWVLVALVVHFDLETLTGWPLLGIFVLYFGIDYVWDRVAPAGVWERVLGLARRPWASEAAAVLGVCLFLAIGVATFRAAERGLAGYTPSGDTI